MDPLEQHLSTQAADYADFFWHRVRWKTLRSYLPRDRAFTLLDVGAGAGLVGTYLAREYPLARYEFIEPIASLEADLVARYGADRNQSEPGRALDADVVTLLDVIEHVDDDHALLADLRARCRPGTTFVVTVPAGPRLWSPWDDALGHRRRYTRRGLRTVLEAAGCTVTESSYLFPELVPAALWRARRGATVEAGSAEFPVLPRPVDRALLALGTATSRARRYAPFGTSVFASAVSRRC
jgi:hypothetical protein